MTLLVNKTHSHISRSFLINDFKYIIRIKIIFIYSFVLLNKIVVGISSQTFFYRQRHKFR